MGPFGEVDQGVAQPVEVDARHPVTPPLPDRQDLADVVRVFDGPEAC